MTTEVAGVSARAVPVTVAASAAPSAINPRHRTAGGIAHRSTPLRRSPAEQALDLLGGEPSRLSRFQGAEGEGAEAPPPQVGDRVADGLEHAPDLALSTLVDREL